MGTRESSLFPTAAGFSLRFGCSWESWWPCFSRSLWAIAAPSGRAGAPAAAGLPASRRSIRGSHRIVAQSTTRPSRVTHHVPKASSHVRWLRARRRLAIGARIRRRHGHASGGKNLMDPQDYDGTGEAHQQNARSCCGDQVYGPWMAASAGQIEVSGAAFVPICLKAHGSSAPCACWDDSIGYCQNSSAQFSPGPISLIAAAAPVFAIVGGSSEIPSSLGRCWIAGRLWLRIDRRRPQRGPSGFRRWIYK